MTEWILLLIISAVILVFICLRPKKEKYSDVASPASKKSSNSSETISSSENTCEGCNYSGTLPGLKYMTFPKRDDEYVASWWREQRGILGQTLYSGWPMSYSRASV